MFFHHATIVRAAVAIAFCAAFQWGCKAKPAADSGFLQDTNLMTNNPNLPFNRFYWNKEHDPRTYTEIMVAPVNTSYVLAQNIWEKAGAANITEDQVKDTLQKMAVYIQQSFTRAAAEDPRKRFTVVDKPGPHTIILEVALVQVVPSKAVMNALGYVTWVPAVIQTAGSIGTGSEDTGKGVIAIEARFRDGGSGIGFFTD